MNNQTDVSIKFKNSVTGEEKLKRYVLKNTSIDEETYDKNYRKDWFMFSEDILKYKIADKIIDNLEEVF